MANNDQRGNNSSVEKPEADRALREDSEVQNVDNRAMTHREQADAMYDYMTGASAGQMPVIVVPDMHLFWAVSDSPAHPQSAQRFQSIGYRFIKRSEVPSMPSELTIRGESDGETVRFNELVLMGCPEQVFQVVKKRYEERMHRAQRAQYDANVAAPLADLAQLTSNQGSSVTTEGF